MQHGHNGSAFFEMAAAALVPVLLFACAKPSHAVATADSRLPQDETSPPADGGADTRADASLRDCSSDADCVAVDRVGCCHNGWKEAVAASAKEAYARSFTCPEENPMCPMYIVRDTRVAVCAQSPADHAHGLCAMVRPDDVACGGSRTSAHACPTGYRCTPSNTARDGLGKCESTTPPAGPP